MAHRVTLPRPHLPPPLSSLASRRPTCPSGSLSQAFSGVQPGARDLWGLMPSAAHLGCTVDRKVLHRRNEALRDELPVGRGCLPLYKLSLQARHLGLKGPESHERKGSMAGLASTPHFPPPVRPVREFTAGCGAPVLPPDIQRCLDSHVGGHEPQLTSTHNRRNREPKASLQSCKETEAPGP